MTELAEALQKYEEQFQAKPTTAAFAPGRVNLIGEHTDYNDGYVLPFALPYRTVIVGAKSISSFSSGGSSNISTVVSYFRGEPSRAEFVVDGSLRKGTPTWANYVKGTVYQYLAELGDGFAFNAVIVSSVPVGSGLSSSAALEVAVATFLEALCGGMPQVTSVEKALRCQRAEHTFADTPCGIMDQFVSAMGSPYNLLLLDCRTREFELVPFGKQPSSSPSPSLSPHPSSPSLSAAGGNGGNDMGSSINNGTSGGATGSESSALPVILVVNSNVKHELTGSEYPDRVRQCRHAVDIVKQKYPQVQALRDVNMRMLDSVRDQLPDVAYKRARHVVSEDERVLGTVAALSARNYATVGRLMTESHRSLRVDYEVSCEELDILVDIALQAQESMGVYGCRMTGGGFGGCVVALVDRIHVESLQELILTQYTARTGKLCECYVTVPSAGAGVLDISALSSASSSASAAAEGVIDVVKSLVTEGKEGGRERGEKERGENGAIGAPAGAGAGDGSIDDPDAANSRSKNNNSKGSGKTSGEKDSTGSSSARGSGVRSAYIPGIMLGVALAVAAVGVGVAFVVLRRK